MSKEAAAHRRRIYAARKQEAIVKAEHEVLEAAMARWQAWQRSGVMWASEVSVLARAEEDACAALAKLRGGGK